MMNIDAGFVRMLNEATGLNLTWQDFTELYRARKAQRDADPRVQARRRFNEAVNEMLLDDPEQRAKIEAAQKMLVSRERGRRRIL